MFSQMRDDTARTLPAQNFIDDEIRNQHDLPPRYARVVYFQLYINN